MPLSGDCHNPHVAPPSSKDALSPSSAMVTQGWLKSWKDDAQAALVSKVFIQEGREHLQSV